MIPQHHHHVSDVALAAITSGALAGFLTNGLETLAVKKQTRRNFSIRQYMSRPGAWQEVALKGSGFRTFYYGVQGLFLFLMLEQLKVALNVESMDD